MRLNRFYLVMPMGALLFVCSASAQSSGEPSATLPEVDITATFVPTSKYCPQIIANPSTPEGIQKSCENFLRNHQGSLQGADSREFNTGAANPYAQKNPNSTPPASANNTAGDSSGGGNSNSQSQRQGSAQPQQQALQAQEYQCSQAQNVAYQNCVNPSVNVGGGGQESAAQVLSQALGSTTQSAGSISALCDQMKHASHVASALDAYLTNQCHLAIAQCASACRGVGGAATCSRLTTVESTMLTQADEAQLNAKIANDCQTKTQVAQASTASANGSGANGTGGGITPNVAPNGSSLSPFNNGLTININEQQTPPMPGTPPTRARLAHTRPGGSAGYFVGNSGNANSAASANLRQKDQKGWNTHIMRAQEAAQTASTGENWGSNNWPNSQSTGFSQYEKQEMNLDKYLPTGQATFNDIILGRSPASLSDRKDSSGWFEQVSNYACARGFIMSKSCIKAVDHYSQQQYQQFTLKQNRILKEICIWALLFVVAIAFFTPESFDFWNKNHPS